MKYRIKNKYLEWRLDGLCRTLLVLILISFNVNKGFSQSNQEYNVKGVIIDAKTNEPLPGATVQILNTTLGVTTDFDGNYKLSIPINAKEIIVSYVGYRKIVIPFNPKKLDVFRVIQMFEDAESLEGITIVAFL